MAEKDSIYSTSLKAKNVVFDFGEYYKFCYDWLMKEIILNSFAEKVYSEKISGDSKEVEVKWEGSKKISDYFRLDVKVEMRILGLKKVEVTKADGSKKKADQAMENKITIKGVLVRDYQGKFEKTPFLKFLRGMYERWIVPERINQVEAKIVGDLEEFTGQIKAYQALEGNTYS